MNVMKYDTEYLILLDRLTMNIIEQVESFQNAANHFHGTAMYSASAAFSAKVVPHPRCHLNDLC